MKVIRKATLQDQNQLKKVKSSVTDEQIFNRLEKQTKEEVEYLIFPKLCL